MLDNVWIWKLLFDAIHCLKQQITFTHSSLTNQHFNYLFANVTIDVFLIVFTNDVGLHNECINDKHA